MRCAAEPENADLYERDRARALDTLRVHLGNPAANEALFLASPSLHSRWVESDGDPSLAPAAAKYLLRMASRCTPFGLFAGNSVGRVGRETRLELQSIETGRRKTRLDMEVLERIVERATEDPDTRAHLRFQSNSSLADLGSRLHYSEARQGDAGRGFFLVGLEPHEPLRRALEQARRPSTLAQIADAIAGTDIDPEVAREFAGQLLDAQLVTPTLGPPVTGPDALTSMIEELQRSHANPQLTRDLVALQEACSGLDGAGLGQPVERYRELATTAARLVDVDRAHLVQVDLVKPVRHVEIEAGLVRELVRAKDALLRLFAFGGDDPMVGFRAAFEARYGERTVPLLEVLDEESGIGFQTSHAPATDPSPLLAGLPFPGAEEPERLVWGSRGRFLATRVAAALSAGEAEIRLDIRDLEPFASAGPQELADSFHVMATILDPASDNDPVAIFDSAGGPSGARLLGRFCHGDPVLEKQVREHLHSEEALDPEVLYFEVVHLPEGRTGNILARPVLRELELEFLGTSGAPEDRRLRLDDLTVTVSRGRTVLRSRTRDCEVRPRTTTAYNSRSRSLPVYRFLSSIQTEGRLGGVTWGWGALDTLPRLPRVRLGRIILARAQWYVPPRELEQLRGNGHEGFRAVQRWRTERELPRWVGLVDQDNILNVDLDNPLAVEAFLDAIRGRAEATVQEVFCGSARPDAALGPEGRFTNEIVVPLVRRADKIAPRRPVPAMPGPDTPTFIPGSEWLSTKIYAGIDVCDELLTGILEPLTVSALEEGLVDRWFFVRYGDPDWHLRIRWHGEGAALCGNLLPRLHECLKSSLQSGRLHRIEIDSYQPELRRYGGIDAIQHAEQLFFADSTLVAQFLATCPGDEGLDARWRMALLCLDRSMEDAGLDLESRHDLSDRLAQMYGEEFEINAALRGALRERFRAERGRIDAILDPAGTSTDPGIAQLLEERFRASAAAFGALRKLEQQGRLAVPLDELVASLMHMHANRMLRGAQRAHELVLFRFLERAYSSRLARRRTAKP